MRTEIFDDSAQLAHGAADAIAELLSGPGAHSLGLAGGSTPKTTYEKLSARNVDWDEVHFWLGDERWVPPDSPECNARMAREHLTDHVGGTLHEVPYSEDMTPQEAAAEYERTLRQVFGPTGRAPDVVLLGLGDDGHTASLFPDTEAIDESTHDYVANFVPKADMWRLTATTPLLQRARHLIFLVAGEAKAEATRLLIEPDAEDPRIPARRVAEGARDTTVLLDQAAAAGLRRS